MPELQRILIANRGEIARRLIRQYKAMGVETVSVFSEPDVEQPWVEEADYSAYLTGRTVAETYLDPTKVIAVAMDAGCDAIHPGYCFLAERLDFAESAALSNVAVIGNDPRALGHANDRFELRRIAREHQIPLIPASDPLPPGDDGVAAGAQLGFPLMVKALAGGVVRRVDHQADLPAAVATVRDAAAVINGDRAVYLERAVDGVRRVGTVVVGDRHGNVVHLGETDSTLQFGMRTWVEELGEALTGPELHARLGKAAVELASAIRWVGVARVRWAVTPDGGWYFLGFSGRLTTGYNLAELVHGIDLVQTQLTVQQGEPLAFRQADVKLERHGVQLRIVPFDATNPTAPVKDAVVERLVLPQGDEHVLAETGTAEGQPCTPDTDPLLVKLTITGPTRHAALVRARAALEELVIEGLPTNREPLLALLADERLWRRDYDETTIGEILRDN
jgi:acetyl/propionyl-CoA carboxylase alpha subunit